MILPRYGLGISVVDGSVTADRYIYDKVENKMVQQIVGNKKVEQRLCLVDDVARQKEHSLSQEQLKELVKLVEVIEQAYGIPIE